MKAPTILVIDDEPDNLRVVVRHLQAYSFHILTARKGESGIERARLKEPDLILLDVNLPDLLGYEVCRRLKADPQLSRIPVLFLTALSDTENKLKGFEAGGVDYVTKPIEATELMARVQTHLQLAALQSDLEERVSERTAELERERAEREKLLEMLRWQSEQLRLMTRQMMENQRQRQHLLAEELKQGVSRKLKEALESLQETERLASAESTVSSSLGVHIRSALERLQPALAENQDIAGRLDSEDAEALGANPLLQLSTREFEVFQLMAEGLQAKQIAAALGIAASTVSTYRARLLEKLEVEDTPALLKLAFQYELPPWKEG